jgi:succinoglycan biosynthesis protein ExoA
MLDEAGHIEAFVAALAAQDFDGDVELIVADGGSTDGSVELLEAASARAGLRVTVLANPARFVSQGLNACIRRADGDLIVRVDCHSRYPSDYLRRCAEVAERTGAWNVGGIVVPDGRTPMERAVAAAMDSPFGGIGWTRAASGGPAEVDTVTYGAFRPEAFRRAGLFDESLIRNQDDELNMRLRRAGGKVVLDPTIKTYYTPRGSLRGVFRQYYEYGVWKPAVMLKHRRVFSARSLAPIAFVGSLVLLAALSVVYAPPRLVLVAELVLYAAGATVAGVLSLRRRREPLSLLPRVVAVFPTFHVAYGIGMIVGWLRSALRR